MVIRVAVANPVVDLRILGVGPQATLDDVRSAYRRLARRYHPDVNGSPEAAARMRTINAAYAALRVALSAPASHETASGVMPGSSAKSATAPVRAAGGTERRASAAANRGAPPRAWTSPGLDLESPRVLYASYAALALALTVLAGGVLLYAGSRASAPAPRSVTASRSAPAVATAVPSGPKHYDASGALAATRFEVPTYRPPVTEVVAEAVPSSQPAVLAATAAGNGAGSAPRADAAPADASVPGATTRPRSSPYFPPERGSPASAMPPSQLRVPDGAQQPLAQAQPRRSTAELAVRLGQALSSYDRARALYVAELGRVGLPGPGASWMASGYGPVLSPEAGAGVARALYLQQSLGWSQVSAALLAAPDVAISGARRPDAATDRLARARLQLAGDALAAYALTTGPAGVTPSGQLLAQARSALAESDRLHQEWLAEWLAYLAALGG